MDQALSAGRCKCYTENLESMANIDGAINYCNKVHGGRNWVYTKQQRHKCRYYPSRQNDWLVHKVSNGRKLSERRLGRQGNQFIKVLTWHSYEFGLYPLAKGETIFKGTFQQWSKSFGWWVRNSKIRKMVRRLLGGQEREPKMAHYQHNQVNLVIKCTWLASFSWNFYQHSSLWYHSLLYVKPCQSQPTLSEEGFYSRLHQNIVFHSK